MSNAFSALAQEDAVSLCKVFQHFGSRLFQDGDAKMHYFALEGLCFALDNLSELREGIDMFLIDFAAKTNFKELFAEAVASVDEQFDFPVVVVKAVNGFACVFRKHRLPLSNLLQDVLSIATQAFDLLEDGYINLLGPLRTLAEMAGWHQKVAAFQSMCK